MAKPGITQNRKFKKLVEMLDEPRPHVLGYLEFLWMVGYEAADAVIGSAEDVEIMAEYPPRDGTLFRALLDCGGPGRAGFIEETEEVGTYQIHDLLDNAPGYVRDRAIRNQEAQKWCAGCGGEYRNADPRSKYCSENCRKRAFRRRRLEEDGATECDGSDGSDGTERNRDGTQFRPSHFRRTCPSHEGQECDGSETETRAENCDETRDATDLGRNATERDAYPAQPSPAQHRSNSARAQFVFPLKDGTDWTLPEAKLEEYRDTFSGLDIEDALAKAMQWCRDNPKRRKTARGMARFLNTWLGGESPAKTSPEFDRFWESYPKQSDKPRAVKAFRAAVKRLASRTDLGMDPCAWLTAQAAAYARVADRSENGRYIPKPAKWLDGERYDDKPVQQQRAIL